MKHCSVTLHNMKHSAYAPYDNKMKNESYVCKYSLSMLHYSAERKILMEKSSNKLVDLSIAFAVEILNLVKYLKERKETIICYQIGRPGPVSEPTSTKRNMLTGKLILFQNCKLPWKKPMKQATGCCYWEKQISSLLQNMIGWKLSAGKSE